MYTTKNRVKQYIDRVTDVEDEGEKEGRLVVGEQTGAIGSLGGSAPSSTHSTSPSVKVSPLSHQERVRTQVCASIVCVTGLTEEDH